VGVIALARHYWRSSRRRTREPQTVEAKAKASTNGEPSGEPDARHRSAIAFSNDVPEWSDGEEDVPVKGILKGPADGPNEAKETWRNPFRFLSKRKAQEAKALNKGKGKTKGRSKAVRATGSRAATVRANRRGKAGVKGRASYNRTVSSDLHWYDDDQVTVYDPSTHMEKDMILGSDEFRGFYKTMREAGLAEQALILNLRTKETCNLYGDEGDPDGYESWDDDDDHSDNDVYADRDQERSLENVVYERSSIRDDKTGKVVEQAETEIRTVVFIDDEWEGRDEESGLGRSSIDPERIRGGVCRFGEIQISCLVISGRIVVMKHFLDQVEGQVFDVVLAGTAYKMDKSEVFPLGRGGELYTMALPRDLRGFKSTKMRLSVPEDVPVGSHVLLVRTGPNKVEEQSVGTWRAGASYDAYSKPGWCGSAVVVFPPKGAAALVGVHRWGEMDGLNGCEPFDPLALEYFSRVPAHPVKG